MGDKIMEAPRVNGDVYMIVKLVNGSVFITPQTDFLAAQVKAEAVVKSVDVARGWVVQEGSDFKLHTVATVDKAPALGHAH